MNKEKETYIFFFLVKIIAQVVILCFCIHLK